MINFVLLLFGVSCDCGCFVACVMWFVCCVAAFMFGVLVVVIVVY